MIIPLQAFASGWNDEEISSFLLISWFACLPSIYLFALGVWGQYTMKKTFPLHHKKRKEKKMARFVLILKFQFWLFLLPVFRITSGFVCKQFVYKVDLLLRFVFTWTHFGAIIVTDSVSFFSYRSSSNYDHNWS